MRALAASHRHRAEEEEESVFVSMTDMTVSFLFIVMILLAFFASRFKDQEVVARDEYDVVVGERDSARADLQSAEARIVELEGTIATLRAELLEAAERETDLKARIAELEAELEALRRNPLERYLDEVAATRLRILEDLRDKLRSDFPDLTVAISAENDALRFQGEGLFASGARTLTADKQKIVEDIAMRLDSVLPCYTTGRRQDWHEACNPGHAVIEAVQIEGHTDDVGDDLPNLRLSAERAAATYGAMSDKVPGLLDHQNYRGQPVISVAGYGKNRPIAGNDDAEGRATNRRIDLRFIMYSPGRSEEIEIIRKRLAVSDQPG
ncbi:OmpA family protein [Pseudooceanicola sp. 216_PA32_1]|uniref:OmpA family protein n=1 Tax=Pseudooceanicola pacificus TaxID=2676438 RepID=A0A844W2E7_9RHOB|nr:OmpA family protein [Pseudooceanicola pacificus]MWB77265.1 OmpA family protein [Pseudooceanicola pacificus]